MNQNLSYERLRSIAARAARWRRGLAESYPHDGDRNEKAARLLEEIAATPATAIPPATWERLDALGQRVKPIVNVIVADIGFRNRVRTLHDLIGSIEEETWAA